MDETYGTPGGCIEKPEVLEFYQAIAKRPKMYTRGGTFDETCAFIYGHDMASNKNSYHHGTMKEFRDWYAKKYDIGERGYWQGHIIESNPNATDEELNKTLYNELTEFYREQRTQS